jgi:diguanylate cyclase (GGDEF)-like protein/PAS domain S-box-containing protein
MEPGVTITLTTPGLRPSDYRELVMGSPLAQAVVDRFGRFVEVNDAFATLLRYDVSELTTLTATEVTDLSDQAELDSALRLLTSGEARSSAGDILLLDRDGQPVQVQLHLSVVATDHGAFVLLAAVDLTNQRARLTNLAYAATHDPLTGLLNRAGLLAQLQALLLEGRSASVALLDLDRLKLVNDTYGHATGDVLLREIAGILSDITEPDGLACRLAGDEFVVVADTTDEQALGRYLSEQLDRLQVEIPPGIVLTPTASIGTAPVRPGMTPAQVLTQADDSMYAMKRRRQAALESS